MPFERVLEGRRQNVLVWFLALSAVALLPIAAVTLPPILDYPNHMARMHILASLPAAADLARYYAVAWAPVPNLATDSIVPLLARYMPLEDAMRLFLAMILLALAGGTVALHRAAFRNWSLWPLFAFLALYNRMLLWGFLNYLAGIALALWALAFWIMLERRPVAWRVLAGAVLATGIYLAHLAAFGCYALALLALVLAPNERERFLIAPALRRALPALVTLLPGLLLFLLSPTSGADTGIAYGNILRKLDLPVSIFDNYNFFIDAMTFALILIAVIKGLLSRAIVLHPRLRWSLLALLVAYAILPSRLLSASGIDHRLPVAIAFVFLAGADWTGLRIGRRRTVGLALLALFLLRMGIVGDAWLRADRDYAALMPAFAHIPDGAAIAVAAPPSDTQAGGVPLLHFPTLAVISRNGFVPTLFADPLQQPVHFSGAGLRLKAAAGDPEILWQKIMRGSPPPLPGYDVLMIIDPLRPLDRLQLPGPILFEAPRLVLIRLPSSAPERP
jgi:hypothetical protein